MIMMIGDYFQSWGILRKKMMIKSAVILFSVISTSGVVYAQDCKFLPPSDIKSDYSYSGGCKNGMAHGKGVVEFKNNAPEDVRNKYGLVGVIGNFENGMIEGEAVFRKVPAQIIKGTFSKNKPINALSYLSLPNGKVALVTRLKNGENAGTCGNRNNLTDCDDDFRIQLNNSADSLFDEIQKQFSVKNFSESQRNYSNLQRQYEEDQRPKYKKTDCNALFANVSRNTVQPSEDFARYAFCVQVKDATKIDSIAITDFAKTDGKIENFGSQRYILYYKAKTVITDEVKAECAATATGNLKKPKAGLCWQEWAGAGTIITNQVVEKIGEIKFEKFESGWKFIPY